MVVHLSCVDFGWFAGSAVRGGVGVGMVAMVLQGMVAGM